MSDHDETARAEIQALKEALEGGFRGVHRRLDRIDNDVEKRFDDLKTSHAHRISRVENTLYGTESTPGVRTELAGARKDVALHRKVGSVAISAMFTAFFAWIWNKLTGGPP